MHRMGDTAAVLTTDNLMRARKMLQERPESRELE